MPLTPEKKLAAREKRYLKKYFITLETYNRIGEAQGWKCGICGRPQSDFTISMPVDHEHFRVCVKRTQTDASDLLVINLRWCAYTTLSGDRHFMKFAKTQRQAIAYLKAEVTPQSIRGLLCPGRHVSGCNRLMGRVDRPDWLKKAILYLENPPARQIMGII